MPEIFEHEIRVGWGDCDPARIVYTARLPWFALDAINAFWEHVSGGQGWFQMEMDQNIGTPFVHMSMDFRHPVTPRHLLMCKVWPTGLGNTSVRFSVQGWQDGTLCFAGAFVSVFVTASTFQKSQPPKSLVELLTPYIIPDGLAHKRPR